MALALLTVLKWIFRFLAAFILLPTGYYKLMADPHAVHLFTLLEAEPAGRIAVGLVELLAGLLMLYPRTTLAGALLGIGLMTGAIFTHLTKLGIRVNSDPTLFIMAVMVLACGAGLVWLDHAKLTGLWKLPAASKTSGTR